MVFVRKSGTALSIFLAAAIASGVAHAQTSSRSGIFGGLSVGQAVTLQDKQASIDIDAFSGGGQTAGSHRIVEIGPDYLVVEDVVHVTRSWIPLTSIRRITLTNIGGDGARPR
jgi:hypothetical protein